MGLEFSPVLFRSILMRLGETYLIAAEAYGLIGRKDLAASRINTLRERITREGEDYTVNESDWASDDEFIEFILDERIRELFGEMVRWQDLVRTRKLISRTQKYNLEAEPEEKHYLRPIPQKHIDRLSPAPAISEVQNEGYY